MNISVIIVNHNSGDLLQRCVESILSSDRAVAIVVVDNASTDDSLARLESSFPALENLTIIKSESNLGFARANNLATEQISSDYLLYLNPDCILEKDTISRLHAALRADAEIGMVGGLILNPDGSEQEGGRRGIPTPWRSFVRASGLSRLKDRYPRVFTDFLLHKEPLPEQPIDVEAISGACMMVSRQSLEDVGGLDDGYFLHCEDLDWCMRFRQKGWRILFVPDARLLHYKGACSRTRPTFVEWSKHKGMMRFYHKFFRHQYPGPLMWLVTVGVWSRFGLVAVYYSGRRVQRWLQGK